MKSVIGILGVLGVASLVTGSALWIHGWTIAQCNRESCEIMQQHNDRLEADLALGSNPKAEIILPRAIVHLQAISRNRCSDLYDYSGAVCGLALTFSTLAVIAWRRQKLPGIERQPAAAAVPSRREIRSRQTKKWAVAAHVLGIRKKQPMSTG